MNIGIVLSGAMAKGAYQTGALRAVQEMIPADMIKYISCASIGALNGYAFATGKLDRIEEMWRTICGGKARVYLPSILMGDTLQEDIRRLCSPGDVLRVPFYTSLLDLNKMAVCYKKLTPLSPADRLTHLRASVALPICNKYVKTGSHRFYDGGLVDNIPVHPLLTKDLDYIICIYFDDVCYKFENSTFDNKVIKIYFPTMTNISQSFIVKQAEIETMFQDGYARAKKILTDVFGNGFEDTQRIQDAIVALNQELGQPKLRLTTDVVITNLNKVTQRFVKRKILTEEF